MYSNTLEGLPLILLGNRKYRDASLPGDDSYNKPFHTYMRIREDPASSYRRGMHSEALEFPTCFEMLSENITEITCLSNFSSCLYDFSDSYAVFCVSYDCGGFFCDHRLADCHCQHWQVHLRPHLRPYLRPYLRLYLRPHLRPHCQHFYVHLSLHLVYL